MYLRLVQHHIKPEVAAQMSVTYDRVILTGLRSTAGCVFASLLQNIDDPRDGVSMTIWESQSAATAYEESGLFQELLKSLRPYFIESNEWALRLSDDLSLEYTPLVSEPTITRLSDSASGPNEISRRRMKPFAVHQFMLTIKEERMTEFESVIAKQIHQQYRKNKGFIDLILLRSGREYHIVTFWDETVDLLPSSGIQSIQGLVATFSSLLPDFVQWRSTHRSASQISASSEDMKTTVYRCLAAEWFSVHG
jgi:heme-degrading monooxygenase HmoA